MKSVPNWTDVVLAIAALVGIIVGIIGLLSRSSRTVLINFLRNLWPTICTQRRMTILRTIATTITTIMIVIVLFTVRRIPDGYVIKETVKTAGKKIALNMAGLDRSMDNIVHTIINYNKHPDATRNRVYEDALKQAADKGYVFYIPQRDYYITLINKKGDKRLLTGKERDIIEKVLKEIFKRSDKRDQISLMNEVLRDIRVAEELWIPKKRKVTLSELDIIAVVGGYIGELILEQ